MSVIKRQLLTRPEAAEYLSLAVQTLAVWSMTGKHLPVVRMGTRAVRYRISDLDEFIEKQTIAAS